MAAMIAAAVVTAGVTSFAVRMVIVAGISPETGMLLAEFDNGEKVELFPDTHSLNLMDKLLYKKK